MHMTSLIRECLQLPKKQKSAAFTSLPTNNRISKRITFLSNFQTVHFLSLLITAEIKNIEKKRSQNCENSRTKVQNCKRVRPKNNQESPNQHLNTEQPLMERLKLIVRENSQKILHKTLGSVFLSVVQIYPF